MFHRDWPVFLHDPQRPPEGDWRTWLALGGRGAGKTRTGAEWLTGIVHEDPHYLADSAGRIALIGETFQDVRQVMIEGQSGLLSVQRKDRKPQWMPSRRLLQWHNGAVAQVFSANDPDGLRGNQFGLAWCDELAKWPYLEATWNMLQFCLRLGASPRQLVTTTPRPLRLLKKLVADPNTAVTRSATLDNRHHLASSFLAFVTGEYGGTRLGRQEIEGEIIEQAEGALWRLDAIDALRLKHAPPLMRIVIAVDPPASSSQTSDACGIVAAGKAADGICYVLADATLESARPEEWANAVACLYRRLDADCVVAEVNQGGEMVRSVLMQADASLPVHMVRASRGKWLRAEPVAMLYARGRVRHAGTFRQLEDQMCDFTADGLAGGRSPDRLDALVWALHELVLKNRGEPKIRAT
nr:terminase family protein [Salaquimonas pukyongi]